MSDFLHDDREDVDVQLVIMNRYVCRSLSLCPVPDVTCNIIIILHYATEASQTQYNHSYTVNKTVKT